MSSENKNPYGERPYGIQDFGQSYKVKRHYPPIKDMGRYRIIPK